MAEVRIWYIKKTSTWYDDQGCGMYWMEVSKIVPVPVDMDLSGDLIFIAWDLFIVLENSGNWFRHGNALGHSSED